MLCILSLTLDFGIYTRTWNCNHFDHHWKIYFIYDSLKVINYYYNGLIYV